MTRFGLYPPPTMTPEEIWEEVKESDGSIRVNREKCRNCPFIAGSSFSPQLKRIVGDLKTTPWHPMQCHNTFPSDVLGAICRGGYDNFLIKYIDKPHFIDQQTSSFQVIPYPKSNG